MTSFTKWAIVTSLAIGACHLRAEDTAALAKRLHNAADASSLDDPVLKPWYLKLTVQVYGGKGDPAEEGTIEEWWTPDQDKRVYKTPSYSATEIRNSKGLYRTTNQPTTPWVLNELRELVVHPMATSREIDESTAHFRPDTTIRGGKLDCIMLEKPIKNFADPPAGYFPTYCLDQSRDLLRFFFSVSYGYARLNKMGNFQGRTVALDPVVVPEGHAKTEAQVAALESRDFDPAIFSIGEDLERRDVSPVAVASDVMAKQKITTVPPQYPPLDKQKRISGTVLLSVLIGTDGLIHRVRIVDTPNEGLAISAIAAVRRWTYSPYLLKGLPVEVSTTIAINYNLTGGGIVRM